MWVSEARVAKSREARHSYSLEVMNVPRALMECIKSYFFMDVSSWKVVREGAGRGRMVRNGERRRDGGQPRTVPVLLMAEALLTTVKQGH